MLYTFFLGNKYYNPLSYKIITLLIIYEIY